MTPPEWRLPELLSAAGFPSERSLPPVWISQVADDSRAVQPGAVFIAIRGNLVDGHRYVPQAVARGARAVVVEEEVPVPAPVISLKVASTRAVLGPLAHAFYGSPTRQLQMVGVTGTKGKTTVAALVHHLLESFGVASGLIGTLGMRWRDQVRASDNTTPGVVLLQEALQEMAAQRMQACAMEVSSHALDQRRTDGIRWACGVFTNLDPEHLDYHGSLDRYRAAKRRLFEALPAAAAAVLHRGDPSWSEMASATQGRVLTYGVGVNADFTARQIRLSLERAEFELVSPEGCLPVCSRLIGLHNVENLLAALAALYSLGVPLRRAAPAAEAFRGVAGRLERIDVGQSFPVFVDYAHTDGALRRVLDQLRQISRRKIVTVFGCGGDRDRTKRPRMGRVAAELSDRVIVTSDNPRSEDPARIAEEIAAGMIGADIPCDIILDRRQAIRAALESADEGWLVLIAGKGHESQQIFADRAVPFDDRRVVRELLGAGRVAV